MNQVRDVSGMGKNDEGRGTGTSRENKVCEGSKERPHVMFRNQESVTMAGCGVPRREKSRG